MHVIVCLDDRNGMLFHHRRQSRDRAVVADIMQHLGKETLYLRPFSLPLFQGWELNLVVDEQALGHAGPGSFCFVEGKPLKPWEPRIERLILYRWNRRYPGDTYFDLSLEFPWRLESQWDFPGYSHKKITKEIYCR